MTNGKLGTVIMWKNPIHFILVATSDPDSFKEMHHGETGLPLSPHPGSFGFKRKHHTHEGIDLYCPEGTPVFAVEDGKVVAIIPFTGADAVPPSPWWRSTEAVLVEGKTGVVVYGEIGSSVTVGQTLKAGDQLGAVKQVLTKDKGRPMSMLHLELHDHGTRDAYEWLTHKPQSLRNPTPFLINILKY